MGLISYLFGAGGEQQRGDSLDAQLAALNARDYGPGGQIYDTIAADSGQNAADATYKVVQADEAKGATGNVDHQIATAFGEGIDEGAANIRGTIGGTVKGVFGTTLKLLPWWIWLAIIVGVVGYFGGFAWLGRRWAKAVAS